ncbi:hypothetical protein CMEL01_10106 [Colletotrichum melonis]|uniref:Uncharacterized protein n=1 Tax=Colletotrichum melonis TaxID=1209925 RepID=A0AAI9TUG3_9PEZI|nr:hypothetical protein CMEL01_10106 [Colletotrichum melonis]
MPRFSQYRSPPAAVCPSLPSSTIRTPWSQLCSVLASASMFGIHRKVKTGMACNMTCASSEFREIGIAVRNRVDFRQANKTSAWPVVSVMHSANSSFGHEAVEKAAAACARGDDAGDGLLANIPQTQHGRASALQLVTDGVQADATLDDGQTC